MSRVTGQRLFGWPVMVATAWPLAHVCITHDMLSLTKVGSSSRHTVALPRSEVQTCVVVANPRWLVGQIGFSLLDGSYWDHFLISRRLPRLLESLGWPLGAGNSLALRDVLELARPSESCASTP